MEVYVVAEYSGLVEDSRVRLVTSNRETARNLFLQLFNEYYTLWRDTFYVENGEEATEEDVALVQRCENFSVDENAISNGGTWVHVRLETHKVQG